MGMRVELNIDVNIDELTLESHSHGYQSTTIRDESTSNWEIEYTKLILDLTNDEY